MDRRSFIKAAACTAIAGGVATHLNPTEARAADKDLDGIIEMHVHCEPDTVKRYMHAYDFVQDCKARGYKAVMLKCHQFNTNEMASTLSKAIPGIEVFGSITLNQTFSTDNKINVFAAKQALAMRDNRCKCVWLPTQAAVGHLRHKKLPGGIPVLDEHGKVVPEVVKLMELCAEKDVILAAGHSSGIETVAIAKKAKEVGFKKFVCTHITSQMRWDVTLDQAKECLDAGAYMEHCFINWYDYKDQQGKDGFIKRFIDFINLDPSHNFVDTDMGQPHLPHPCDGMKQCLAELRKFGCSEATLRTVTHDVPAKLLNLTA